MTSMLRNEPNQKISFMAINAVTGAKVTGDTANITAEISKDYGTSAATNDVNPTERDATDHPGIYDFDLLQAETDATVITITPASSTPDVIFRPATIEIRTDPPIFHADIDLSIDEANNRDEWTITFFKNGVRVTSGITLPKLQVLRRVDGTALINDLAMTQIGTTGSYKFDATGAARITAGEAVLAIAKGTMDGSERTFPRVISRDSS